ncbi:MAG: GreA/GreB family elongation factor [Sphingorhabdus sp.]
MERINPITPAGFAALRARYEQLFAIDRPAVVEIVHWAAGNGDRSENGDYIYGKQKLRAIDRELGQLSKKMKVAKILDPAAQEDRSSVFFGATVTMADINDVERVVTLIGDDEAEAGEGRIGWNSPLARALRGAKVGDVKTVTLPTGPKDWEVIGISYPS